MKLRWADVKHTTNVSVWDWWGARVEIGPEQIRRWQEDPEGVWEFQDWNGMHQGVRWHPSKARRETSGPTR
jgi:hypothetical protein